ncbi:MAG: PQQ-binding-like beta-propeller repeat protein [Planctomycetota bacterium]
MRQIARVTVLVCSLSVSAAPGSTWVGWRTDGTGSYTEAKPATEWSTTKNVVRKSKMPSWGNATPVLVGDRILVGSEPMTLVCVNAADGKVLWTRSNTYFDLLPEEKHAGVKADVKKAKELAGKIRGVQREIHKRHRRWRKLEKKKKELEKAAAEEAGGEKKTEKEAPKEEQKGKKKEKADEPKTIEEIAAEQKKLKAEIEEIKKKLPPLQKAFDAVNQYLRPPTNKTNGFSTCTPATDGEHVWMLFGNGVLACYDLEGERRWIKLVRKPSHGYGHSASPVLAEGKVVVHIRNELVALDKATGKELWKAGSRKRWGTPVVTTVGDVCVVVTANGDVVRASDGKPLAKQVAGLTYCAPIIHEGVAYFIQHGGRAVKLEPGPDGAVKTTKLWTTKPKKDRYYASPVYHDGLLYCVTQKAMFSVIDAKTGEVVHTERLKLGRGTVYPSIAVAGGFIFVSSDSGRTAVLEPGRKPKLIATNELERFRSSPVFQGDRLYVRAYKHLYWIGK